MNRLFPCFLICMIFACLSNMNSAYDKKNLRYLKKEKLFCFIIAIILILFAGLRVRYNDTATYIQLYRDLQIEGDILANIEWSVGANPGFQLTNCILKSMGLSAYSFIMFYAIITEGIYLWFIRKYSDDFTLSLFVFLTGGTYLFSLAALKQCVAVAIALIGINCAIQKKWLKYVLWILLATTFHTYALLFFILPFIRFVPWTKKTYYMLGIFLIIGLSFPFVLGKILDVTALLGENYDPNSFVGEGVNVLRLLVTWAPIILAFLARNQIRKSQDRVANLILNLSMINAEIMFIARFGTAFYLARVANYFSIFQVITIPWLLRYYTSQSQKIIKFFVYIGFFGFAYYAYAMNRSFDVMYDSITIFEYMKLIFE